MVFHNNARSIFQQFLMAYTSCLYQLYCMAALLGEVSLGKSNLWDHHLVQHLLLQHKVNRILIIFKSRMVVRSRMVISPIMTVVSRIMNSFTILTGSPTGYRQAKTLSYPSLSFLDLSFWSGHLHDCRFYQWISRVLIVHQSLYILLTWSRWMEMQWGLHHHDSLSPL